MAKDIITIAGAINSLYKNIYTNEIEGNDLTEMKMHKLLYFAQKNHYNNFGKWLFNDDFEGWVHGPVNTEVRSMFNYLPDVSYGDLTFEEEYTIRETLHDYGKYSAFYLRNLSHQDSAFKKSRVGLSEQDIGNEIVEKNDIIQDIICSQQESIVN